MRLHLAGYRWAGVYWDDGGLLSASAYDAALRRAGDRCCGRGLALEKGHFAVPTRSGLGIKVDMEMVERYRVA